MDTDTPWKMYGWKPKSHGMSWFSDEFPAFNWVIFRFLHFLGGIPPVGCPLKVSTGPILYSLVSEFHHVCLGVRVISSSKMDHHFLNGGWLQRFHFLDLHFLSYSPTGTLLTRWAWRSWSIWKLGWRSATRHASRRAGLLGFGGGSFFLRRCGCRFKDGKDMEGDNIWVKKGCLWGGLVVRYIVE